MFGSTLVNREDDVHGRERLNVGRGDANIGRDANGVSGVNRGERVNIGRGANEADGVNGGDDFNIGSDGNGEVDVNEDEDELEREDL